MLGFNVDQEDDLPLRDDILQGPLESNLAILILVDGYCDRLSSGAALDHCSLLNGAEKEEYSGRESKRIPKYSSYPSLFLVILCFIIFSFFF